MKKYLNSLIVLALTISMVFSVTACKKDTTTSDTGSDQGANESSSEQSNLLGGDVIGGNSATASTSGGNKTTGGGNSAAGTYPSSIEGKTIEVFNWNPASEYTELPTLISAFEKASGCKVKWTIAAYSDYNVELAGRIAANNAPDVVRFTEANVAELELTQPLANSGYDFSGSEWDQTLMKYYTVNGKAYATNRANSFVNSPYVLGYNKDLISTYDFEDPYTLWKNGKWTMEKLVEMCEAFYKSTGSQGCHTYKYDSYLLNCGYQGIIGYKDGKYTNNMSDKKCLSIWSKMYTWNTNGVFQHKNWDRTGFINGKYLFMEIMAIHLRTSNPYYTDLISTGSLGVVPWPAPLASDSSTAYTSFGEYEAYGIAKGSKNAEAVPYYLDYVLNSDNLKNKNGYFFSQEVLNVYQSVMSNKNRIMHTRYPDGQMDSCSAIDSIYYGLRDKTPAQISTYLTSNKSSVDSFVKGLNTRLSALK